MILIFANHNSDWKYRAGHRIEIQAIGTKEELVKKRNEEIRELFIEDLMSDFENDCNESPSVKAVKALKKELSGLSVKKLYKRWMNDGGDGKESPHRWEMKGGQDGDDKGDQRLFCGGYEGASWACSWTILEIAVKGKGV